MPVGRRISAALVALALIALSAAPPTAGAQQSQVEPDDRVVPGELLVRFAPSTSKGERNRLARREGARVVQNYSIVPGLALVDLPKGTGVKRGEREFEGLGDVRSAEPNLVRRLAATPNDTLFPSYWGLPAIDAPEAWELTTGSTSVRVGVIDSGVALQHPDLAANLWTNPAEAAGTTGVDDDGNGEIDDVNGYDFVENDASPDDGSSHGTHVAGTIGAEGDNGFGGTGVAWNTRLMALKAGMADGRLFTSSIIAAIQYADAEGAQIVNASYTGDNSSQSEREAMAAASDILFVAAAGNDATDNDLVPRYPCSYPLANIICVAATNQSDQLANFGSTTSNYGDGAVDLAAPGTSTLSTIPTFEHLFAPSTDGDQFDDALLWTLSGSWAVGPEESASPLINGNALTDSPGENVNYVDGTDSPAATTNPIDLSGRDACRVVFKAAWELAPGDAVLFELSIDGTNWGEPGSQNYARLTGSKAAGETRTVDLFNDLESSPTAYFRFRLVDDGDGPTDVADGVHIDDFRVQCELLPDDPGYTAFFGFKQGTSMASPHVAGAAALLLSRYPSYTPARLRGALLENVDPKASLAGRVATGGRLNVHRSLLVGDPPDVVVQPPNPPAEPPVVKKKRKNKCKKIKNKRKRKKCNKKRKKRLKKLRARG